jgi:phage shock protein PspC (stress-responsive transcriptional regulator)
MEALLNVIGLFFLLSGVVAWGVVILLMGYYWLCMPNKEE